MPIVCVPAVIVHWIAIALTSVLLDGVVVAQAIETPRVAHPGRVLDAAGDPVANAEVTFITTDSHSTGLAPDIVRAAADGNGRFRTLLWPTRSYRGWAIADEGQVVADLVVASRVVPMRLPMTEIRFAAKPARVAEQIALRGLGPWREHGSIRVEALVDGVAGLIEPRIMDDGAVLPLPALPVLEVDVRFYVADRLVHIESSRTNNRAGLPAPHQLRGRVCDAAGQPIAGVRIERMWWMWRRSRSPFPALHAAARFVVAETDADGHAAWLIAGREDPRARSENSWPALAFVASKPGYAEGVSGFTESAFCNDKVISPQPGDGPLPFVLEARQAVEATIRGAPPVARLLERSNHSLIATENSYYSAADLYDGGTVAGGAVTLPPRAVTLQDAVLHLTEIMPRLGAAGPFHRAVVPRPLQLVGDRFGSGFDLDLATVVPLRVQLLDVTGGPAMGAHVACLPITMTEDRLDTVPAQADAAGRIVLPILPGEWLLIGMHEGSWAKARIVVEKGHEVETLKLEPMPSARLRVIDREGQPVANVRLGIRSSRNSGTNDAVERILNHVGFAITSWSIRRVVSDADGRLEVPFLPSKSRRTDVQARKEGSVSRQFELLADEDWTEITLQ